jgi:mRNA-degrading endonuclease RelE of RelBE toxin-antitoxin system
MNTRQLVHEFEVLPPELQKQVVDFVCFLRKQQQQQTLKKRTVGEYKGKIRIADDFY